MHDTSTAPVEALPIHPRTGLRALGVTSRGPIWPVLGGSGDDGPGDDNADQSDDTADDNGPDGNTDAPRDGNADQGDELANATPADLARMVRDLRAEAGRARTGAKAAAADEARRQLAQDIGKALGLVADDDQADPAKLAEQAQAKARDAAVELAAYRRAGHHQADADALLDSRAFRTATADLDPNAADFAAKVDAAIAEAVKTNPKLKAAGRLAGASGVGHSGGSGDRGTNRPKNLAAALSRHYGT